jgi:hypothetical protein
MDRITRRLYATRIGRESDSSCRTRSHLSAGPAIISFCVETQQQEAAKQWPRTKVSLSLNLLLARNRQGDHCRPVRSLSRGNSATIMQQRCISGGTLVATSHTILRGIYLTFVCRNSAARSRQQWPRSVAL